MILTTLALIGLALSTPAEHRHVHLSHDLSDRGLATLTYPLHRHSIRSLNVRLSSNLATRSLSTLTQVVRTTQGD